MIRLSFPAAALVAAVVVGLFAGTAGAKQTSLDRRISGRKFSSPLRFHRRARERRRIRDRNYWKNAVCAWRMRKMWWSNATETGRKRAIFHLRVWRFMWQSLSRLPGLRSRFACTTKWGSARNDMFLRRGASRLRRMRPRLANQASRPFRRIHGVLSISKMSRRSSTENQDGVIY